MMKSILLENVVDKKIFNCNGDILIINGSGADFGAYNNLLANLKSTGYQEQDCL